MAPIGGAANERNTMFSTPIPSGIRPRRRAVATLAAVIGVACLAPATASAGPPQHTPPDLPVATKACKLDTSPSYPSCGGISEATVAVRLPDPWFTTEPCKHDTSPSYPSCGSARP